ncbi:class I SAM-dependent methyltransferase [Pseudomaricurvus alkylphenolicus]|uniref:class I SAM-dependent methyltransferase n=1 Tax=Pseudomaricurvus alkylphenolicus TaxID=1306991 RepID=UPI001F0F2304|nr:class I SAM-dependent methyltransferase [Pseudomaricurvus alkylphenolicus]
MSDSAPIPLICEMPSLHPLASELLENLPCELLEVEDFKQFSRHAEYPYALILSEGGLALQPLGKKAPGPVRVDFAAGAVAHRRHFGGGRGQMIAKAVGVRPGLKVLDATAGMGKDAFVLASLGCEMTLLERTPVVAELLGDGLRRARHSEDDAQLQAIAGRMHLHKGDARLFLSDCQKADQTFDVVYLDPMFPERSKSASVKKDMAVFHQLVGRDEDAGELLPLACELAHYRVVVKRPRKAPLLGGQAPTYQLSGKTSRYDIYVNRSLDSFEQPIEV